MQYVHAECPNFHGFILTNETNKLKLNLKNRLTYSLFIFKDVRDSAFFAITV